MTERSQGVLLAAAVAMAACAHQAPAAASEPGPVGIAATETIAGTAEVTGTVTYRQRIALPPDAVVHVRLEDVSRADAPATVIAEATGGAPSHVEIVVAPVTALEETCWRIVEVDGAPVEVGAGAREPHILLHTSGRQLTGSTGCNELVGTYELGPGALRLVPKATTMMACLEPLMRQERAILDALVATTEARVAGTELELREGGTVRARLEARNLR